MLLVVFSTGCGGDSATAVSGKITYDGKAVPFGVINFMTAGGKPKGGPIAADGTYHCELPPGEYQVRIDAKPPMPADYKEGDPQPELPPRPVPEKFANFASSGLTATIKDEASQTVDFTLP